MTNGEFIVILTRQLHQSEEALKEAMEYQNFDRADMLVTAINDLDMQIATLIDREAQDDKI